LKIVDPSGFKKAIAVTAFTWQIEGFYYVLRPWRVVRNCRFKFREEQPLFSIQRTILRPPERGDP
jgi:hypothetical protein